jgi:glutaredoxin 3
MPELRLYYMPTCPYCRKVLTFMEKAGIVLPLRDTQSDVAARQELLQIGGKTQVPCLVIEGRTLYESDDIIQWLKNNFLAS